ncbi:universal stress protein [Caulobacter mirabilis]|uniref:Universal stress protein UspA n=1 Tax=Caulobacter mirabilis TaxID=69666 RepID=A0A2D2AZP3_9CAUL|nr:universal stress protein [Caulobacter mirabilis]ATQ43461.1 universal stress protein UspA [Caulobacter mirabilis]
MSWARIMAPLAGGAHDVDILKFAAAVATPFGAEVAAVHAPADIADLMPWMGEGFMGGVQIIAMDSLKEAAAEGERAAKAAVDGVGYAKTGFVSLQTPVWAGLSMEGRLSDVVLFDNEAARGRGPLAEAFQQIVADEQRPTIVARDGLKIAGATVLVAWDGGKEASRAARTALPMLEKAGRVVIVSAPAASSRTFEAKRLQGFFSARGVEVEVETLADGGDAAQLLLSAADRLGAGVLVAGAFGHPRLQEYIFGGTTRTLLNNDGPSLFLSH